MSLNQELNKYDPASIVIFIRLYLYHARLLLWSSKQTLGLTFSILFLSLFLSLYVCVILSECVIPCCGHGHCELYPHRLCCNYHPI